MCNSDADMTKPLIIRNLHGGYGDHKVLKGIDLEVSKGEFVGLIGPNGTGKSTLLKCIYGLVDRDEGKIFIDGIDMDRLSSRERAQKVAVVPQSFAIEYDFSVDDIVMMGRNPHVKSGEDDRKIVDKAMELTGTYPFRERLFNELSGGERQRVIIARAIAQSSDILLLDEPISSLDIQHQIEIMEMVVRLNKEQGKTVIAVLHDLNLAARYCSRLIIMKDGQVRGSGTPAEMITQTNLRSIYNMDMIIRNNSVFDRPEIIPIRVLENAKVSKRYRIHVICGSGEAGRLLQELADMGHEVTTGVLNRGADDWSMAKYLGLRIIETEPFNVISHEDQQKNLELMKDSEVLLVANVPFGSANIENLRGLEEYNGRIFIHRSCLENDYTPDGEAVRIFNSLRENKKAIIVNDHDEFIQMMS